MTFAFLVGGDLGKRLPLPRGRASVVPHGAGAEGPPVPLGRCGAPRPPSPPLSRPVRAPSPPRRPPAPPPSLSSHAPPGPRVARSQGQRLGHLGSATLPARERPEPAQAPRARQPRLRPRPGRGPGCWSRQDRGRFPRRFSAQFPPWSPLAPGHVAGHCFGLSSTAGVKGIAEASLPSFQKMPLTNDHCSFLLGHKDVGFSSPPEKRQVKVPRV